MDEAGVWILASSPRARLVDQGWKLHVSAGPHPAQTLTRALSVLAREPVDFKVLATPALLLELSCGNLGASQVGKFITVYPSSNAQALRIAKALDNATRGNEGPTIPSDRTLRAGSVVYYRFGAFTHRALMTPIGLVEPAIRTPSGAWVAAGAKTWYEQPRWVRDPFETRASPHRRRSPPTIAGRFIPLRVLASTTRGRTFLALDTQSLRRCVLKEARAWVVLGRGGSDARRRLEHEASILELIADLRLGPRSYGVFHQQGASYLAMEDIAGTTLHGQVVGRILEHGPPGPAEFARCAARLSVAIACLHRRGLVHRDLKPSNIIQHVRGYRLIDFELSLAVGAPTAWGTGTVGYMPAQQRNGADAAIADDVYGLGALLLFVATGRDPAAAGWGGSWSLPVLRQLNPKLPADIIDIVLRCLHENPVRRPRDAGAVARHFERWLQRPRHGLAASAIRHRLAGSSRRRATVDAVRALCRLVEQQVERAVGPHPSNGGLFLNDGISGAVLALSMFARAGISRKLDVLHESACLLMRASGRQPRPRLPGLLVGDGGIALAVQHVGAVLADDHLVRWSRRRLLWAVREPVASPDFFHGAAGRIWLGLRLREVSESRAADAALLALGRNLIALEQNGLWPIPAGYNGLSGQAYFGYAHGTAGIAHALLLLQTLFARVNAADSIDRSAERLRRSATGTLRSRTGLTWPVGDRDSARCGPFWCHGAAGIGLFFLRLWQWSGDERWLHVAGASARAVIETGRWLGPTRCHGLSGSVEFLLDLHQATDDNRWRRATADLGGILLGSLDIQQLDRLGPGFMVGVPGIAATVLRLSSPASYTSPFPTKPKTGADSGSSAFGGTKPASEGAG